MQLEDAFTENARNLKNWIKLEIKVFNERQVQEVKFLREQSWVGINSVE